MDKQDTEDGQRRPLVMLDTVLFFVLTLVFVAALRNTHHSQLEWQPCDSDRPRVCKARLLAVGAVGAAIATGVADLAARSIGMQ